MTCTKAALWVPKTNSLTQANLTRRQTSDITSDVRHQTSVYSASHAQTRPPGAGPAPVRHGCAGSGPAARAAGGARRAGARDGGGPVLPQPLAPGLAAPRCQSALPRRQHDEAPGDDPDLPGRGRRTARAGRLAPRARHVPVPRRRLAVRRRQGGRLGFDTTARDLGVLLAGIAGHRAASPASCDTMLAILGRQEFNEGIPAGLPPGTRVAHKTGWIGEVVYHDAAIVYPATGGSYTLVVLTGGIKADSVAHNLVADLSRMVYEAAATAGAMS